VDLESAESGPLSVSGEEIGEKTTVVDAPAVPTMSSSTGLVPLSGEGLLEEPNGQLRLFPTPATQAAPPLRYRLPPLSLLDDKPRNRRVRPVEDKSRILVDTLESFGVQARVVNVVHGPTVTRYELQPARGVKVSRFTSLTNDIALALAAVSIRIEAPIPGKSAIGIEVPNLNTELVVLKDILGSENFRKGPGLCLGLGKDITGQAQMTDLQKMPHLLVAGTTGSGKSVCINTMILSLIYRFTPRRLQLLMVDPKQVELSIYEGLPHLVGLSGEDSGRILVDPKKAAMALKQVVDLMEARYTLFAKTRVRNLKEYNDQAEDSLPWMVVIIDELADLMMVASKTVETSICRLAQKARAAGIHLVVATQRPSTDVITGLIKVNIPSRIAFAVSSGVDSRVILDTSGAENLLGKGDMLFLPVDASEPRRIQGAYVTNEEIQRVVEFWREQAAPENRIELEVQETGMEESTSDGDDDNSDDELVQEALAVVLRCQQASASMLQTELKVGYARARRILMILERKGYVGPAEGSKPRKILYTGGEVC
jgi:S-DNA-T family DNA segregation ATPase FtsK/SpoIIIE